MEGLMLPGAALGVVIPGTEALGIPGALRLPLPLPLALLLLPALPPTPSTGMR